MSVADIIEFLTAEIARHGSDLLSADDLRSLGAVEREMDAAAVSDTGVRAAAWIAVVAPGADRAAFRGAYGDRAADLLERLVPLHVIKRPPHAPLGPGLGRTMLRGLWARAATDADPDVRAVATALLSAERPKVVGDDVVGFGRVLDIAVEGSTADGTRERLVGLRAALPAPERPETVLPSKRRTRLISLSIDVVGSTAAKSGLRDLAVEDDWRDELYRKFYRRFLHEEGRFYDYLFDVEPSFGLPLVWRRLFVVKGIGDELWLTYDVADLTPDPEEAEAEIVRATVRLIGASLALVRRTVEVGDFERDTGPGFDPDPDDSVRFVHMELPFKVTLDLIEDAVEISDLRMDFLAPRVGGYLAADRREPGLAPERPDPFGAADVEILNRLNAGHFSLVGGVGARQVYRTDLIGNDVDRFFRITKRALPGCVTVGRSLFDHLKLSKGGEAAPGVDWVELCFSRDPHRPAAVVTTSRPLLDKTTVIPARDLKGIGRPYSVHHLIAPDELRELWHEATRNDLFRTTAEEFPDSLKDKIRDGPPGGRWTPARSVKEETSAPKPEDRA